jgi:hypothetical protein
MRVEWGTTFIRITVIFFRCRQLDNHLNSKIFQNTALVFFGY